MSEETNNFSKWLNVFNLKLTTGEENMNFLVKNSQKAKKYLESHQIHQKREHQNLSEKQRLKLNLSRYIHGWRFAQTLDQSNKMYKMLEYYIDVIGIPLNTAAFLNTIQMLGNQQQIQKWRYQVYNAKAFGGYVQTELGHGSNVQGLQTQAHYDQQMKVFKINSPTVKSAKFWPGVLGMSSTHALMQAQTFVKGKSIGIQTFVVQIRDCNLQNLPGVSAGDIGPKLGFDRVDNGFLSLENIKVPRQAMLMKYVQVEQNGEVIGLQNKQAIKYGYGSMLFLRVKLVYSFAFSGILHPVKHLAMIYKKMGILNHDRYRKQVVQYFCVGEGLLISNMNIQMIYDELQQQIKQQNYKQADKNLAKCHILSSTFKALASWKAIHISRDICTSNIFSIFKSSTIPRHFIDTVPSATYEGDNSVLLQQTAKFILMKNKQQKLQRPQQNLRQDNFDEILKVLEYVTSMQIKRIKYVFKQQFEKGRTINKIWNQDYQRDILQVSKLWGVMNLVKSFITTFKSLNQQINFFQSVGKVYIKNLLEDVPQITLYGFNIEKVESWRQIKDEHIQALIQFNRISNTSKQDPKIYSREGQWIRAKI